MSQVITCPSGLKGRIRGMKVKEERILADHSLIERGEQTSALLEACFEELVDSGPYHFEGDMPDWDRVLIGDRFYLLLHIRALSYGPLYAFKRACVYTSCRKPFEWEFNLLDLPIQSLSGSQRQAFKKGNRFEVTLPDAEKKVWFKILTGEDEKKLASRSFESVGKDTSEEKSPRGPLSSVLSMRLMEMEGVSEEEKHSFIESLSMRDASFLFSAFDEVDCGVDTLIEVECPHCKERQEVDLPLGPDFFLPHIKKKKSIQSQYTQNPHSQLSQDSSPR